MIVAIPRFGEEIAPCFEVANYFLLAAYDSEQNISEKTVKCISGGGFERIRLLREKKIDTLICNGIKRFYRDVLTANRIDVINNVSMTTAEALKLFVSGKLKPTEIRPEEASSIPHEDLVLWAKELFEANGYKVTSLDDQTGFPISFIAETSCPVCNKPVRVAVCCGSQLYSVKSELNEFHRVFGLDYHAQVYVYPADRTIERWCDEFRIELINPDSDIDVSAAKGGIPLLKRHITGHEAAMEQSQPR